MDSTIVGSYNHPVAALAVCISVLASYTALDLAERVIACYGMLRWQVWLISGGVVLGIGIWSMHYTAMWAFRLPVHVRYDWPIAVLSLVEGIAASILALFIVSRKTMGWRAAFVSSLLQGAAISGLHYTQSHQCGCSDGSLFSTHCRAFRVDCCRGLIVVLVVDFPFRKSAHRMEAP
jgi:NO-binding membrane sensor protein with MHYT domain